MNIFNRNGVEKHSVYLISSLIISIAVVFAVSLQIGQKDSNTPFPSAQSSTLLKLSDVEDFHSMEYVPLELGNEPALDDETLATNKVVTDTDVVLDVVTNLDSSAVIEDVDQNNLVTLVSNDEELATPTSKTKHSIKSTHLSTVVIKISNFPVKDGSLSSGFGMRKHPIHGNIRMHSGIDIAAISGTKVQAMGEGIVVSAGRKAGYGNNIEIKHGNTVLTRYSHLKEILVEVGQKVTPADIIGLVGSTGVSTGPHLHLEVALNESVVDPRIFLAGKTTVAAKPIIRQYAEAPSDSKLVANFDEATYQDYLQSFDGLYGLVVPGQTN